MKTDILLLSAVLSLASFAEVIDPGTGRQVVRGRITGAEDVEIRSGVVSASLDASFGGNLKATGGVLELTDIGEPGGELRFTARATPGATGPVPFTVKQNEEFDWFDVTPAAGTIAPGQATEFVINLHANAMTNRHFYHGAFFVGTTNGLSRPVNFLAETEYVPPFRAERPGDTAIYADLDHPVSGSAAAGEAEYAFEVTKGGNYWFLIHGAASSRPKIQAAVDGEAYAESLQQTHAGYPTWTMVAPGKGFGDYMKVYNLTAGRHTLRVKVAYSSFPYDGIVLTDDPEAFEPR